ncbi:multidrug effflux MFS transporter [Mucilaginibacter ginsenosidivorans]|uniref:Multidrug effflux MFS transporter n=1 Tax=Mucilaginibacter ginsenosidivorans TaxID=398053 RepID=A0A5B8UVT7_9SPHI|nr:multidrug effflux MFS transporter [Mucilaginibacter ginsenosidivorans]QEC63184.1 multidrug effflux MFS transporter [Mucilaginibacter ginsenosidivorans]
MTKKRYIFLVLILGMLIALSPFSIDMYLPAFGDIAKSLHSTTGRVELSLSSYFIGLAFGQLIYGPLMDRFGRKVPLYFGLCLYIIASVGCFLSSSVDMLITMRLFQALGGCAAQVACIAMVRDLFPVKDIAKVYALLFVVLGASPLLAPTAGSYLTLAFGWQAVFVVLLAISVIVLLASFFFLPESYKPDRSYSLKPGPIVKSFLTVIRHPQFYTYAISGSVAFCSLFSYVAGSPLVFMDVFGLGKKEFGWVFAGIAVGFIGAGQVNTQLLKRFKSEQIIAVSAIGQVIFSVVFLTGALNGWFGLWSTIAMVFVVLFFVGLTNPNTSALSMAPFPRNAGVASALLGAMQLGLGALSSSAMGLFSGRSAVPLATIMAVSAALASFVLFIGRRNIVQPVESETPAGAPVH